MNANGRGIEMPKNESNGKLHLPELSISGFRGIRKLRIGELGRVTLLTGKNGVGKTTVLEAVQIFASRARNPSVWKDVFYKHDEYVSGEDAPGERENSPDLKSLFYGRELTRNSSISIGPSQKKDQLEIKFQSSGQNSRGKKIPSDAFVVTYNKIGYSVPLITSRPVLRRMRGGGMVETMQEISVVESESGNRKLPAPMKFVTIGPGLLQNEQVAQLWDDGIMEGTDEQAIEALKLMCGPDLERVNLIGDGQGSPSGRRRPVAKFSGRNKPVPLRSLGDGAIRIFGLTLALVASSNGFLLVDEIENGIHHSVQAQVWGLLLRMAEMSNVQIIATTHGSDCVKKFAEAAWEEKKIKGMLIQLEKREDGDLQAVEYPEKALLSATRHNFEVR